MRGRCAAAIYFLSLTVGCQSSRIAARDDPAVIAAAVAFRQASGFRIYKVLATASPNSVEYAQTEIQGVDTPHDVAASLLARNIASKKIPESTSYRYSLTSIISWDVIRLSLPGYSRDHRTAAIY